MLRFTLITIATVVGIAASSSDKLTIPAPVSTRSALHWALGSSQQISTMSPTAVPLISLCSII
jgi:hypothetical protein